MNWFADLDHPSFCSLALPEQVDALLNYVVREVPPDSDDKTKFIYPYKASEVCMKNSILDMVCGGSILIKILP
jgi:hypothetical protein